MSRQCGNCDCSDWSQCTRQESSYVADIVETENSYVETTVTDVQAGEHEGKCKCGDTCACTNCTCDH